MAVSCIRRTWERGIKRRLGFGPGRNGSELTLAFARTDGGMTFSGPNDWRGSMNEVKIFPHFLHSAVMKDESLAANCGCPIARDVAYLPLGRTYTP